MLYWLHQTFDINILGYITIRAGISYFIALLFTLFFMPRFIKWAQRTSSVQPINEWAPDRHKEKASTPTMGGIVFISASIIASLLTIKFSNSFAIGAILTLILFLLLAFKMIMQKLKKMQT